MGSKFVRVGSVSELRWNWREWNWRSKFESTVKWILDFFFQNSFRGGINSGKIEKIFFPRSKNELNRSDWKKQRIRWSHTRQWCAKYWNHEQGERLYTQLRKDDGSRIEARVKWIPTEHKRNTQSTCRYVIAGSAEGGGGRGIPWFPELYEAQDLGQYEEPPAITLPDSEREGNETDNDAETNGEEEAVGVYETAGSEETEGTLEAPEITSKNKRDNWR